LKNDKKNEGVQAMTALLENQFKITIRSPTKTLVEQDVVFVILPGTEGEFGVLKDHTSFVTTLKVGEVKIYREDRNNLTQTININGGFADIKNNHCHLLVQE
jgi:F-type H+-transporting ATPase subunit epsilon